MALTNEQIKQKLTEKFADQVSNFDEPYGMLTFEAPKELNLKVLNFLYDDDTLKFRFMTDLTAVHYPAGPNAIASTAHAGNPATVSNPSNAESPLSPANQANPANAGKGRELAVVYHLHNLEDNIRIRFKVFADINKPDVYTASGLFSAANWMEREAYDFYGVNFVGHPNLKRILNVDEMDYFPMRKEFPLEDQTRVDKDDEMFGRGGRIN
jgi:NADH-quinone oxidoreductase subunit C